jgi:hypothetical protein
MQEGVCMNPHLDRLKLPAFAERVFTLSDAEQEHIKECRECFEAYIEESRRSLKGKLPKGVQITARPGRWTKLRKGED